MTVLELLSDPESWTKGTYARDANGAPCEVKSASAVRFCLVGAMYHVYTDYDERNAAYKKLNTVVEKRFNTQLYLTHINDQMITDHAELLSIIKEAGV